MAGVVIRPRVNGAVAGGIGHRGDVIYRAGDRVGTSITEGTANFLVNRRMNKSPQMRWSRRGADLLLQVRGAVYNARSMPDLGIDLTKSAMQT
jgi:hypothetical protein